MNTLPRHFEAFLKSINPPEDRRQLAKEMPQRVRKHLREASELDTEDPHTRLIGSYRRHTAVGDIRDVDILVFLGDTLGLEEPWVVLAALHEALEELPGAREVDLRDQRRSVRVTFEEHDFVLDVVPAVLGEGLEFPLDVPDKTQGQWIPSHPIGYQRALSALNSDYGEKVVPLIKLFKYARDVHLGEEGPKSYWLECEVYHLVEQGIISKDDTYAQIFTTVADGMYTDFKEVWDRGELPYIEDPMIDTNIAAKWNPTHFHSFLNRLGMWQDWSRQALEEDDTARSVALWCEVFGAEFENALAEDSKTKAAAGLFANSNGRIHNGPDGVKVKPHKYYGEPR